MKLSFEGLEMQKWNKPIDGAPKIRKEKWGHFSSYHIYYQSYGHYNVTTPSFFVFSAGGNKKNELQFGQNI